MPSIPYLAPIGLLIASNVFMSFAWYGHLKFADKPLWLVIIASWGIALIEHCFAVPANWLGHQVYSAARMRSWSDGTDPPLAAGVAVPR